MNELNRTPRGRVTGWLAIAGSLVCFAGCAAPLANNQLTGNPLTGNPPSARPALSVELPIVEPGTPFAPASQRAASPQQPSSTNAQQQPSLGASGTVMPVGHTTPAGTGFTAAPADRYEARQFPNDAPFAGPTLQPGNNFISPTAPSLSGTGLVDPYAPVPNFQPGPRVREADLVINGFPARTGRIILGGAVNSDAGVTGNLTIDERNFDITRWPRSFQDLFSGTAFRGAGQTFRIEAAPGTDFKRYTMQFADPNIFGYKPVSMSVSGFLFDRRFNDWDEERKGGRLAFGYRVTPDLSVALGISAQNVDITRPRVLGIPQLDAVLGSNSLYSGEVTLKHDTRDTPIQAARGHYFEFKFEEAFGDFDYARFELEFRRYWLVAERADRTGRQTISYSTQVGFSGEETPIFENFFAGGYSTIRGFDFRGASPKVSGVEVGGRFQWLNTVEYMFPLTADDAFRGVAFVDFGTVEQDIEIKEDNFRVAPGMGLRVAIPMLGPAPLAFDFAYPIAMADTDERRIFSFYMSLVN